MISKEEYEKIVKDVGNQLSGTIEKQIEFERERLKKFDDDKESRLWLTFYSSLSQNTKLHRDDLPKYADEALKSYKERFNNE